MSNEQMFSEAQKLYMEGLARGLAITTGLGAPSSTAPSGPDVLMLQGQANNVALGRKLVPEEKMKQERHPLDRWSEITARAQKGEFPKGTDILVTKYFGMFYVSPAQEAFMCRMRLPNGVISSHQLRGVARIAENFGGGYTHVTTRANLQIREIAPEHPVRILNDLCQLGIISKGSGADNVRNITASPLSGIDPLELVDTRELTVALNYHIVNSRELYGLPRKFNIAIDGGGSAAMLGETNDLSFQAARCEDTGDIYFRVGLGGITGHGDFAKETPFVVHYDDVIAVADAVLKVFIEHGNRSDRKKARLKYLLGDWGHDGFMAKVQECVPGLLRPAADYALTTPTEIDRYAHIGAHAQRQDGLYYLGVGVPVGKLTTEQMQGLADIAETFASGDLRLTVWQNIIIADIPKAALASVEESVRALGLDTSPNAFRSNLVACTGSAGCKFAAADTKRDAIALADYLETVVTLDHPLNIHVTGCHHSCAQHVIGDIGLMACKVMQGDDDVEAYDIFVGGGYAADPKIGTLLQAGVVVEDVPVFIEKMLRCYQGRRLNDQETFRGFIDRFSVDALKAELLGHIPLAQSA